MEKRWYNNVVMLTVGNSVVILTVGNSVVLLTVGNNVVMLTVGNNNVVILTVYNNVVILTVFKALVRRLRRPARIILLVRTLLLLVSANICKNYVTSRFCLFKRRLFELFK